jgi:hypothetical protein
MLLVVETGGQKKKKGRGALKGFKESKKRYANGSEKLNISFSEHLGGTVGMNYCTFVDDMVLMMKKKVTAHWSEKVGGYSPYHPSTNCCRYDSEYNPFHMCYLVYH